MVCSSEKDSQKDETVNQEDQPTKKDKECKLCEDLQAEQARNRVQKEIIADLRNKIKIMDAELVHHRVENAKKEQGIRILKNIKLIETDDLESTIDEKV